MGLRERYCRTAHDINHSRPADGGIMLKLMLDNAKAFDRLQHTFMLDVLHKPSTSHPMS